MIKSNGYPLYPLFDNLFSWMNDKLGGVFSTLLFFLLILYLQICLLVGIMKVGLRLLTVISIHPIEYNGTWMNAFFVNLIIFLCCNFALTLFVCKNMPKYTAGTYA